MRSRPFWASDSVLTFRTLHSALRTPLQAMEQGVPYAFTYRPENDQFMIWACEPLSLNSATFGAGTVSGGSVTGGIISDVYDRHDFELNDRPDNRQFHFLSTRLSE